MNREQVLDALSRLSDAQDQWREAIAAYRRDRRLNLHRLLNEAAALMMSAEDIAPCLRMTPREVRRLQREANLDPKRGRRLLSKQASRTLAENARLLGIDPTQMDLTSPLAYLPMGDRLKRFLETESGGSK